ncbi:hypothetical protein D3C75_692840 [compost metagenome]
MNSFATSRKSGRNAKHSRRFYNRERPPQSLNATKPIQFYPHTWKVVYKPFSILIMDFSFRLVHRINQEYLDYLNIFISLKPSRLYTDRLPFLVCNFIRNGYFYAYQLVGSQDILESSPSLLSYIMKSRACRISPCRREYSRNRILSERSTCFTRMRGSEQFDLNEFESV